MSLVQAHQQSLLGLSQSSTSIRGPRTKPKAEFRLNVQKQPVPDSKGDSVVKKPCLDTRSESHQVAGSQLGLRLPVLLTLGRRGAMGDGIPDVLQYVTYLHNPHLLCKVVHFQNFSVSGEALLPIGLCLIWLMVTIFSLDATIHYSIIQMV